MALTTTPARIADRQTARSGWALSAVVLALSLGLTACAGAPSSAPSAPSPSQGIVLDRPVPTTQLVSMNGLPTSLAAFRGKYVVMAPFLTLCQDECPLITGAFLAMERSVRHAGLGGQVVFLTVSIDPWRDTPARLTAYAKRFGTDWPMLAGSMQELTQFWNPFGVFFEKVPEGEDVVSDWWTGQPLTMEVLHTDGFILIDRRGHERFLDANEPQLHGRLRADLKALLDRGGIAHLEHASGTAWTVDEALAALGWMMGRTIPTT